MHFLSAMQGAPHLTVKAAQAAANLAPMLTLPLSLKSFVHTNLDHKEHELPSRMKDVQKEENMPPQVEDSMQLDRISVEEQSTPPEDLTFNSFLMAVWSHYSPYW
jgi:hypothetical protein